MGPTERVTFYDQHPFDWVGSDASEPIHNIISRPLVDFIETLEKNALVLDIGCGPGRVLRVLACLGVKCAGLDRSSVSISLATKRYGRPGVVGDNSRLPFADGCADAIISDGVVHHTEDPESSFAENCRVLKPSGRMYLAVYKPAGRYPWLYKYPGALIRSGLRRGWTQPAVTVFAQVPYFLVHFLRSRGRRTWTGARNLFFDYFVTPRVTFLPRAVVDEWCARHGARIVLYDENRGGNVHSFWLVRESVANSSKDLEAVSVTGPLVAAKGGAGQARMPL